MLNDTKGWTCAIQSSVLLQVLGVRNLDFLFLFEMLQG